MQQPLNTISSNKEFSEICNLYPIVLFYFSQPACNVCKVLKPKISELIQTHFPKIKSYYINTQENPEIAGQQGVFTVPVITVWVNQKESHRSNRNISINELKNHILRPYTMIFDS